MAYAFIQGGGDGHVEVRKEVGKREVGVKVSSAPIQIPASETTPTEMAR